MVKSHSHFKPNIPPAKAPKKRKLGRYILLLLILGLSAIWWGPKLKGVVVKLFKSSPVESTEKVNKKKAKSSSSVVSSSSETLSSSAVSEAKPVPAEAQWQVKQTAGEWVSSYRFEAQEEWNSAPLPSQLHSAFVEQVLAESRQKCGAKSVLISIHSGLKSPFAENAWSYKCGEQENYYKLANPNSGAWLTESGCRKSAPCWSKPMASFIPVTAESVGKLSFLRFKPTVPSTIVSPERLQVKSIEKSNGQIILHLQKGFSWRVDLKGFLRLNPAVEVGQIFEKGAPLGESSGTWPLDFVIYYQGQNWSWNQAYQYSYPKVNP